MNRFIALLISVLLLQFIHAQKKDTVILMNGNLVVETVLDTSLFALTIPNIKKPGKNLHYEFQDVFCVHFHHGEKKYYYKQDTSISHWFTRDEMDMFIKGERDGRKGFKAKGALIGAGVFGFIGGASGTFFAPLLPYGFMGICGIPKVRIRHNTISNPAYIDYDPYILGYERSARYKRRLKSLLGGTVGLVSGYLFYFAFKDYYPTGYTNGKFTFN